MKKSLKTLLVMAVVLVVLGGAAVALWLTAPETEVEEESSSSTPSYPVIDREAADVESISIESDAGDFTIVPLEDEETSSPSSESSASSEDEESASSAVSTTANFTLEEYQDYELTTSRINTSVNNIVGLSATKELGAQEDLDTFGLTDEALCTITVHYKDGGEDQLVLGAEAGESSGNYILKDGEVYIGYLPSQLYYGPFTYFDNEVYAVADRVSETEDEEGTTSQETLSDQLNSMELSGANFPQPIKIVYDDTRTSGYLVTEPVTAESGTTAFSDMVTALKSLTATQVVDAGLSQETLEKYGLAQPAAKITFDMNGEEHTLAVSAPDEEGVCYLTADDHDVVYEVTQDDVSTWAGVDLMDLRMSYIWLPNIQDVRKLTLTVDGDMVYSYDVTKVLNEEKSTDSVPSYDLQVKNAGGEDIDYEVYQDYYQDILSIAVLSAEQASCSDSPTLRIEYEYFEKDGSDVIEFFAVEGKDRYAAELNGEFNGLVRKQSVEDLVASLPDLDRNYSPQVEEENSSTAESEASSASSASSEAE